MKNIGININCGTFSYAEIPSEFSFVLGVTGTLETLTSPERERERERDVITNDYKIKKETIIPSIFGENHLDPVQKIFIF